MIRRWEPDLLGAPFEQRTLPLGMGAEAAEGDRVATIVRAMPRGRAAWSGPLRDSDVLYVHGWSDYFFQRAEATFWTGLGARFYALDLHGYGRSLRPGVVPGYVDDLSEYDADLGAAFAAMGRAADGAGARRLVLAGHSTGALTLTLWSARHPGTAAGLALNSPWLELQIGPWGRQALTPLVNVRAKYDPLGTHPVVDLGFYTRAQRELGTLPDAPEGWRPERGFPTHPGWLRAILAGHAAIAAGVDVGCPALVLLSAASTSPVKWEESMTSTDSVLVVDDIARAALRIGRFVTVARIEGAVHDVFLSRPAAARAAYDAQGRFARMLARGG